MRNGSTEIVSLLKEGKLKEEILEALESSPALLTFGSLEKILKNRAGISRRDLKRAVDSLVSEGELAYTYKHGSSFLEKSFEKPVRVSKRIILVPHMMNYSEGPDDLIIRMRPGASFGRGDHPTTRLGLRCIEYVFGNPALSGICGADSEALDIGAGSGILAIACVLFGTGKAKGIDTDPCARKEAGDNAEINGIGERLIISDESVEKIKGRFSIITANLRSPTLIKLYPLMIKLTDKGSIIVLSGIKTPEAKDIQLLYTGKHFLMNREESEKDWRAFVFSRI